MVVQPDPSIHQQNPTKAPAGSFGVQRIYQNSLALASEFFRSQSRCPRTATMWSSDPFSTRRFLVPIRCKSWKCEHCAKVNAIKLESRIASGKPSHFITLTCKPSQTETPKEAHDRCRPFISRMMYELRKKCGKIEYACILEQHQNGFPHWHIVARCSYIPHSLIKHYWLKYTGNSIVGIEKIRQQKQMGKYLVKYVTKGMIGKLQHRLGRVISFSRNYLSCISVTPKQFKLTWHFSEKPIEQLLEAMARDFTFFTIEPDKSITLTLDQAETRTQQQAAEVAWVADD